MSVFDLREFNTLSKRHNYFMTNYRIEGFPTLKENSLILRKILECRNSNSTDKRFENNIKPKKIVRFTKPENIPYSKIYQSQIIIKKKQNNSNGANRPRRLVTNLSKNDSLRSIDFNTNNQIIMSPQKDKDNEVNKNLLKPYYRIRIYSRKAYNCPEINNPRSPTFNNINSFDNENDPYFLNLNGRKFFTNSFCGVNSDTQSISPEKNLDNNNVNKIGTELFRNYDELNKKQFEIYKRKIKKNPISKRKELYEKQKEKELKKKKLNIQFQEHMNDVSNDENKMRIIPITKKVLNNINNIKRINNRFRSNKRNYNSNNNINHNHKSLSFIINDNNNNSLNKTSYYKAPNNYNKINNISFSKESNPNSNLPISNNILYSKKAFKSNIIYISKYSSPRKIDENNFIENSDTIRQKYVQIESPNNDYNNKAHSLDRHNNPYNFIVPKKRFVEDYTFRKQFTSPVFLSSNDHKVCIKVHLLHGINELFYGKVKTKEKLKMQRVISICFIKEKENEKKNKNKNGDENNENKNKNENENENKNIMIGANFIKNKNLKNKFDLKSLSSIKEEEEKSKLEHDTALLKSEAKQEIKEKYNEENNGKKYEKINPDPDLDKNKAKENQKLNDNQKVRIKLLKEKPEIELIKLEPKVEKKDNQNSNNTIKRRRFQRSYPNLMSDVVNEQAKVEIKEENNFRNNIRRKYERSKDKSETKKDEPKIEIKDNKNSDKNIRRRFQRSNPKSEVEASKNETKDDKKENQNQSQIGEIKSFRRRFQRSNPKHESELNKNEQKNDFKDIKENKNQIKNIENNNNEQKEKEKDEKPKIDSKSKLIEIEQNIEIKEKSNFRRNYRSRRRFDNSSDNLTIKKETKNEPTEKKNLEENATKRRLTTSKLESGKQLKDVPLTESKENINSNNRFAVRRFKRTKQENELKPDPVKSNEKNDKKENQSQNIDENYRRRFRKSETEINLKYNIKDNQVIEKDNIKKYEKLGPEQQKPSLKKDKPKNEMEEKQFSENNARKRYVRRFGKVK